jgi:hypothetical protein
MHLSPFIILVHSILPFEPGWSQPNQVALMSTFN